MKTPSTDTSAVRTLPAWRSGVVLAVAVLAAVVLLQGMARLTEGSIQEARSARLENMLSDVFPEVPYDNDPISDVFQQDAPELGEDQTLTLYPLRQGDSGVGAVLQLAAPDGYSGPIELLVGLKADGTISTVRVVEHRETPGLGDRIEHRRSDWITQFNGRSIATSESRPWQLLRGARQRTNGADTNSLAGDVQSTGYEFDALTGATITSAAIVNTVQRALVWFERHQQSVLIDE